MKLESERLGPFLLVKIMSVFSDVLTWTKSSPLYPKNLWSPMFPETEPQLPGGADWSYNPPPAPTPEPAPAPSPTPTYSTAPAPTSTPTPTVDSYVPTYQTTSAPSVPSAEDVERERQERLARLIAEYQPYFDELDRRMGETELTRTRGTELISGEETLRKEQIGVSEAKVGRAIEAGRESVSEQSQQTLRELAESGRGWLKAATSRYAGSSAYFAVAEGMGKELSKQRGQILRQRDSAFMEFSRRSIDLSEMISLEQSKLQQWKSSELAGIQQKFQDDQANIRGQKAEGQIQLAQESFDWATQRLASLDKIISDYTMGLQLYQQQREVDLRNALVLSEQKFDQEIAMLQEQSKYDISKPTGTRTTKAPTTKNFGTAANPRWYKWNASTNSWDPLWGDNDNPAEPKPLYEG